MDELREEILSSAGAQDMDTADYDVSELYNNELLSANPQLEVDGAFRPGFDTPVSPKTFDSLEMWGSVENPIRFDNEENEEYWPPTNPLSKRPNGAPALQQSQTIGTRIEKIPDPAYRILFQ